MSDKFEHARGWMAKGDSDLTTVRILIDSNGPLDNAAFHAQQAAEKYLKAAIAFAEGPIPRTHNLEILDRLCRVAFPTWNIATLAFARVTSYAVEARYDSEFWPDEQEAIEALTVAETVRISVVAVLPPTAVPPLP